MSNGIANKTLQMTEGALCLASSVVLSYLVLFRLPQGGSLTLEMAPIMIFALRRGARWGVLCGALSGLLQMMLSGYVVHPIQAALDYPIAFASVGLIGIRSMTEVIAAVVAFCARLFAHVLSGAIFFAEYAPEWQDPWVYSLLYNAAFLVPAMIICWVAVLVVMKAILPREGTA